MKLRDVLPLLNAEDVVIQSCFTLDWLFRAGPGETYISLVDSLQFLLDSDVVHIFGGLDYIRDVDCFGPRGLVVVSVNYD